MHINKKLNLVVAVERDDQVLHVHSMPVAYEVFQQFYLVLSKTFALLGQQGLGAVAGPRIAAQLLEDVAKTTARSTRANWWEGEDGVERGLQAEMIRLSNLLLPTENGWQTVQLSDAISREILDKEEAGDVLNQLAFFTVVWHAAPRVDREMLANQGARLYGSSTTSSSFTEFATFLKTSTKDEPTGENASGRPSSTPSSGGRRAPAGGRGQPEPSSANT